MSFYIRVICPLRIQPVISALPFSVTYPGIILPAVVKADMFAVNGQKLFLIPFTDPQRISFIRYPCTGGMTEAGNCTIVVTDQPELLCLIGFACPALDPLITVFSLSAVTPDSIRLFKGYSLTNLNVTPDFRQPVIITVFR